MSVYINSNDVASGTSTNGRYDFGRQISGNFIIQDYNFENVINNWCDSSNNSLYVYPTFDVGNTLGGGRTITFANLNSSSSGDLIQWFSDAFNQLVTYWAAKNFQYLISYNIDTDKYTITFSSSTGSGVVAVGYLLPSEIPFPGDPATGSTIASLFGWTPDGDGVLFDVPGNEMIIPGINFGIPRVLEVDCPQMRNKMYTSKNYNPSFLLTTTDQKIYGQKIYIPTPTTYLDLKVYKVGYRDTTYSLLNNFSVILKQV